MDAAGEHDVVIAAASRRSEARPAGSDRPCFPEHEAGARPDVAAALATFEDEAGRAVLEELRQQSRARGRADTWRCRRPPVPGLSGTSAGDDRERRLDPRGRPPSARRAAPAERSRGCRRPRAGRRAAAGVSFSRSSTSPPAQQARARNGKRAVLGHRGGEFGPVADAGHRALDDRVAGAVRLGQGRPSAIGLRARAPAVCSSMASRSASRMPATEPPRRARLAAKAASWPTAKALASASCQSTRSATLDRQFCARLRAVHPAARAGLSRLRSSVGDGRSRPGVQAEGRAEATPQANRFGAVHRRDSRREWGGQG